MLKEFHVRRKSRVAIYDLACFFLLLGSKYTLLWMNFLNTVLPGSDPSTQLLLESDLSCYVQMFLFPVYLNHRQPGGNQAQMNPRKRQQRAFSKLK